MPPSKTFVTVGDLRLSTPTLTFPACMAGFPLKYRYTEVPLCLILFLCTTVRLLSALAFDIPLDEIEKMKESYFATG